MGTIKSLLDQFKMYLRGPLVSGEDPAGVISEFIDVRRETIRRWDLDKQKIQGGEVSARLAGFLLSVGLLATEISSQLQYEDLYKGLGLKVITFDELLEKIDVGRDAFTRFLRGEGVMSVERMQRLEDLINSESYQARLAEKMKSIERLNLKSVSFEKNTSVLSRAEGEIPKTNGLLSKDDLIRTAASMTGAILPLLLVIDSKHFSDEERREFRRQVSNDGIFRLSNCLSRLCSRTAREMCSKTSEGGE